MAAVVVVLLLLFLLLFLFMVPVMVAVVVVAVGPIATLRSRFVSHIICPARPPNKLTTPQVPSWCFQRSSGSSNMPSLTDCLGAVENFGIHILPRTASFVLDALCLALIAAELMLKLRVTGRRMLVHNRWWVRECLSD